MLRRFRPFVVSFLIACLGSLTAPLVAQTFYGSVVGVVTDASSSAIQGATVTLLNTGTGERHVVTGSADGSYRFVNLVPGNYRLDIEQSGFKRYTRDQIAVNVEAVVRVDVALEVGEVSQSIEVQAESPLLETENASLSQVVGARSVQELPLNGRNVLNLVTLAPGVVPQGSSEGNLTGKNVFSAGNYQIGGGTSNQSAIYFDGVPVTRPSFAFLAARGDGNTDNKHGYCHSIFRAGEMPACQTSSCTFRSESQCFSTP